MKKTLRLGVIGCGSIFPNHLAVIKALEYCQLVMVCDINRDLVIDIAKENNCQYTTDYERLLANESIDIIHVLTPHYLHTKMAIEALKANKHVVLEKPVGINFDELKVLNEMAEKSGKTVGVTLQNRYNPTSIKMKEFVDSKVLGSLIASKGMVTWNRRGDYYSKSPWRGRLAYEGGGVLINQAIHSLDLLQYIGGKVAKIEGVICNHNHPDIEVEDTALATLHYENGGVGSFYATNDYGENSNIELEFIFEKGKLRLLDHRLYVVQDEEEKAIANDSATVGTKSYWGKGHLDCITNIYESIIDEKEPAITLKDAINATELVLGIYKSSKTQKTYFMEE